MSIFNLFKTNENSKPSTTNQSKINLRKETFKISLEKKSMQNTVARVALVIDKSGSMQDLYYNNTVQDLVERLLPVAIKLDDNSELDIWVFNNYFKRLNSVTEKDFNNYVNKVIMSKVKEWGGTSYSPVMEDILKKYIKENASNVPTFVIFVTDGENDDHQSTIRTIREASNYNIFWQFIGIGNERFTFLKNLDTLDGRKVDNANFIQIQNINNISDEKLYDLLINEYPSWEKEAKKIGIIK